MKIAVVKETVPGERRVALVPANLPTLQKASLEVVLEAGAGEAAGFADSSYVERGGTVVNSRAEAISAADLVVHVRGVHSQQGDLEELLALYRPGQVVIGLCDPLGDAEASARVAATKATLLSLEMIPRITRAQSMDVLSSMATIAGYRAVLLAAVELPKMFPLLMTAAGTITAARVFVIGAGVAGLQAIATARRLGGVVQAYDVRPACREQVESLGAKFVELELETGDSEDKGGYAKAMQEEFYQQQRSLLADIVAESDVVITTAAIPGKTSPLLITEEAVVRMPAGGVIVDLAAERGGNCAVTKADQRVVEQGKVVLGPTNLPAEIPYHASQMFSNNLTKLLLHLVRDGALQMDIEDEIIRETMITHEGEVTHGRIRSVLDLPPLETSEASP